MIWTKERPSIPGWYWFKDNHCPTQLVFVEYGLNTLKFWADCRESNTGKRFYDLRCDFDALFSSEPIYPPKMS